MSRPIIFFDLETTGLNIVKDRIVQIGAIKVCQDKADEVRNVLINPGMPIPPESTEIHGITDAMVADKPTFEKLAKAMLEWFRGCDLAGHNICGFDISVLSEEFARCGITFPDESVNFIDTLKIERMVNAHKLEHCYKRYTGKTLTDAHDALADAAATKEVFFSQMKNHKDLPDEMKELELFCNDGKERVDFAGKLARNDDGDIVFTFGNSKGNLVKEDRGFGNWILGKDFPTNTKNWIRTLQKS